MYFTPVMPLPGEPGGRGGANPGPARGAPGGASR